MLSVTTFSTVLATLAPAVLAHVAMVYPPPLRSQSNEFYNYSNYDYSMTAPLLPDGSNYPCKGYQGDVPGTSTSVATLKAGGSITAKFTGSATHGGGSCQFSMSYDGGESFAVIHSVIGGCPLQSSYDVPIPDDLPAGKNVLFAWTWYNRQGNREMYMNCAAVDVEGSSSSFTGPAVDEANVFGGGDCITVEGVDFIYPNPGKSVVYGGSFSSSNPPKVSSQNQLSSCSFNANAMVTVKGNGKSSTSSGSSNTDKDTTSASSDSATSKAAAPTAASNDPSETPETTPSTSSTSKISKPTKGSGKSRMPNKISSGNAGKDAQPLPSISKVDPPSTAANSSEPVADASCTQAPGIACSSDGGKFYMCGPLSKWIYMGVVAPGTKCVNGAIVALRQRRAEQTWERHFVKRISH